MSFSPTQLTLLTSTYTDKGWTFTQRSTRKQDGSIEISWIYKSPRMAYNGFLPAEFTEEILLNREAKDYALDQHGATIAITMNSIQANIIEELAKLYLMQSQGTVGVEIPSEVVLHEVKIPIRGKGWNPSNKVVEGKVQES